MSRGSSNNSHVRVRYRTDESIKIVYKQKVNNGRRSMRAVIRYGLPCASHGPMGLLPRFPGTDLLRAERTRSRSLAHNCADQR